MWNWLKKLFQSTWMKLILKIVLARLQEILTQVGEEALGKIKLKVIEVSASSLSNQEKLKAVVKYVKELMPSIKDSAVNLLVESIVNQLKTTKEIA